MLKVLSEIKKVERSWKYEGYCFLTVETAKGDRGYRRKYYEKKDGRVHALLDNKLYSFKWNGNFGEDIRYEKDITENEFEDEANEEVIEATPAPLVINPENGEVKHMKYDVIKACISEDIPVYLVGPAGSGKNHTLEQIAWELGLEFYFTNSIQQEYKLTGFIDAGGKYHETEFYRAFTNGGLFFLDEMDASIPEVLVLLNAAIANKYFEFPTGMVSAHESFRVVSAGNTVGNGADEQYTGRLVLDQATLDRFAIIEFDYDLNIEMALAKGNTELVSFIRNLRVQAKEKGVRATFSYRCITMVTKLEGKLMIEEVMIMAIFKGMDKDTINTFRPQGHNKYDNALRKVQG